MSELSFEQMLDETFKTIRNGEVVEGTVIDVKEDEIILNIDYKADGIISRSEYSNDQNLDLRTVVHPGDTMEAKVLKLNDGDGQVLLTYKRLAADKGNKRLEEAFENKEVLTAKVNQVLDGGLSVVVEEARVFIPASLVSDTYEKDLTKYQDQEIEFVITEFNPKRRRVIGDRKQLLVAKKEELKKELFERIQAGDVVEGTIKNVTAVSYTHLMSNIADTLSNLVDQTAFMNLTVGNLIMIFVAFIFLYLAIAKGFEPLLLVPIAFGMLLVNIYPDIMASAEQTSNGVAAVSYTHLDVYKRQCFDRLYIHGSKERQTVCKCTKRIGRK